MKSKINAFYVHVNFTPSTALNVNLMCKSFLEIGFDGYNNSVWYKMTPSYCQHQPSITMQGGRGQSYFPVKTNSNNQQRQNNRNSLYSIPPPNFTFKPGVSGEKLVWNQTTDLRNLSKITYTLSTSIFSNEILLYLLLKYIFFVLKCSLINDQVYWMWTSVLLSREVRLLLNFN